MAVLATIIPIVLCMGFSHTALSGTGVPDYSDILFMPTTGKVQLNNGADNVDEGYASRFSHDNEEATAGFYKTTLDDHEIDVELTASKRVGFHKYMFPEDQQANVIIDLDHRDKVVDSWIRVVNDHEVEGFRRSTAWANDQHLYFVAVFSHPIQGYGLALSEEITGSDFAQGENIKGYFQFDEIPNQELYVKDWPFGSQCRGCKAKHKSRNS